MTRQFIGEEDGDIVIHKKECLLINDFAVLFKRDKGSKKDLQGKHQIVACGEMKYIYYHLDPRSEFYNIPLGICHIHIIELSGLPDNWKVDKVFEKACEKYKDLQQLSSLGSAYFSADSALFELGHDTKDLLDIVRTLKGELKEAVKTTSKKNKEYTLEELEIVTRLLGKLDAINKVQSNIIALINSMPKLTTTIKDLKEQYSQEDNESNIVVGDRQLGNRED
jgi:hypothetical protein